jgi:hypothetical protein
LARQLQALATQEKGVVDRLSHPLLKHLDFLTIYFTVDDSVRDVATLLVRLLQSNDALAPWIPLEIKSRTGALQAGASLSMGPIRASLGGKSTATEEKPELPSDVVSVFNNAIGAIADSGVSQDGVLIIVDEFDRIGDKNGFASLVKSCEGRKIRFAIVGVARDIENLVLDHLSIARQIANGSIYVPPMSHDELRQIFIQAHERLNQDYIFSVEAIEFICSAAKGHPYLVHLLGRQALISNVRGRKNIITIDDSKGALREISTPGSNIPVEMTYKKAVKNSPAREYILKRFASEEGETIRTTEVYEDISRNTRIEKEAISVYMGHLVSPEYGAVLEKAGERYYRFADSVFKAYAAAREYELPQHNL